MSPVLVLGILHTVASYVSTQIGPTCTQPGGHFLACAGVPDAAIIATTSRAPILENSFIMQPRREI